MEATRAEVGRTPAWEALLRLVDHCVALPLPLAKSLLTGEPQHPELPELEAEVNALIAEIAADSQREGDLRADVPLTEVVRVLNVAVCRRGARADDHLTRVLLDGLRAPKNSVRPPVADSGGATSATENPLSNVRTCPSPGSHGR
jgi:transcriptional regulator SbtR-like protein